MGVALIIWGRFASPDGNITPPAPCDNPPLVQDWLYDMIRQKLPALRQVGFKALQGPPCTKAQGGQRKGCDGYAVYDPYDIGDKNQQGSVNTRWGSAEMLRHLIAAAHANDMQYYHDLVAHQRMGGVGQMGSVYEPLGSDGKTGNGRWPMYVGCFRGDWLTYIDGVCTPVPVHTEGPLTGQPIAPVEGMFQVKEDQVPNTYWDISFGSEVSYQNGVPFYRNLNEAGNWVQWLFNTTGADGARIDDVKGLWPPVVARMASFVPKRGITYGEFFDNADNALAWAYSPTIAGKVAVEDFQGKFSTQNASNADSAYPLNQGGVWSTAPTLAITFAQNPDTDLSAGQQTTQCLLLAYAETLTNPGYPMVAGKDYFGPDVWPKAYGLQPWIDPLVTVHETMMNGDPRVLYLDNDIKVKMSDGYPGLLTGLNYNTYVNRSIWVPTTFGANVELELAAGSDKAPKHLTTNKDGWVELSLPCNAYNNGQSYVCYSRKGYRKDDSGPQRQTTQEFYCQPDLALPVLQNGEQNIAAVYCDAGTELSLRLVLDSMTWVNNESTCLVKVIGPQNNLVTAIEASEHPYVAGTVTIPIAGRHQITTSTAKLQGTAEAFFTVTYTAPKE